MRVAEDIRLKKKVIEDENGGLKLRIGSCVCDIKGYQSKVGINDSKLGAIGM
ncbi:uncharacterized protein G2W53_003749 [Senna tora]|uniref:Uncharacterized protein n=1 Tax=Senna tora TaxID=362788 RepID=A0A835CG14_9FABA|nr:uncharacterized protein G2W53_003749 [Senna tora]